LLEDAVGATLLRLPPGKGVQNISTDFLKCFYNKIMETFENRLTKAVLEDTPMHFHLTVPGTWKGLERNRFLQSAQDAGYGSRETDAVFLLDEGEAAVLAALIPAMQGHQPHAFKVSSMDHDLVPRSRLQVDSSVMLIDCGGGTCDGCVFIIKKLKPLKLEEACARKGTLPPGTQMFTMC
jgi:hypothetical protein